MTFCEQPGPTALQSELVHALAFSDGAVPLDPTGAPTRAALVGVWNGEQGLVVVLLRQVEPPAIARFQFEGAITSLSDLERAVQEAHVFVESFGFRMDASEFLALHENDRARRLKEWNAMRKVRKKRSGKPASAAAQPGAAPGEAPPRAPDPTQGAPAASQTNDDTRSRAILGRLSLLRRGRQSPLARILGHF